LFRDPGNLGFGGAQPTCDTKSVDMSERVPGGQEGGRPGMVFEEATPTTPKPAEPHGTQEMRRT
jgi:hypothetical protein